MLNRAEHECPQWVRSGKGGISYVCPGAEPPWSGRSSSPPSEEDELDREDVDW